MRRAYSTKAQVKLLSVKRVEDPKTGNRDVVNVQMWIRRLEEQLGGDNMMNVGETAARNPQTTDRLCFSVQYAQGVLINRRL